MSPTSYQLLYPAMLEYKGTVFFRICKYISGKSALGRVKSLRSFLVVNNVPSLPACPERHRGGGVFYGHIRMKRLASRTQTAGTADQRMPYFARIFFIGLATERVQRT